MAQSPSRTIPEELVLLCASPADGRLRMPSSFHRVLAGGVLAELLLTGAISVEGRRITGFQPLGDHEPVAAGVLTRLGGPGRRKAPAALDTTLRRIRRGEVQALVESFATRGLLSIERRRLLGVLPYRQVTSTEPDAAREIAARLRATVLSPPGWPGAAERDRQLAGLLGAARLERRLYPGAENAQVRRTVRVLARELPIARAAQRAISADSAAAG